MRISKKAIVAGGLAAVAVGALVAAGPAQADPAGTPRVTDVVGVGAQTDDTLLDAIATSYNKTVAATAPQLASWDAADADGGTDTITEKAGCQSVARPNGGNAGLAALEANARPSSDTSDYCVDFARGSRPRSATDPASIVFIPFAIDAVTWAADKSSGKTNATANLSTTALKAIYSCDASVLGTGKTGPVTWNEVGGKSTDAVVPVVPPSTSSTRSFFLAEIGVTTLGSCVQGQDNSVEQNEGIDPVFTGSNSADIVFPYSVAVFLAQTVHNHGAGDQGKEILEKVDGAKPVVGTGTNQKININFGYVRDIFNVVRNASTTGGQAVPTYLQKIFGTGTKGSGYICKTAAVHTTVQSYGFLFDAAECGTLQ